MNDTLKSNVLNGGSEGIIHIPDVVPLFPLPRTILLPGEVLPLHIFEPRYLEMSRDALRGERVIGIVDYASPDVTDGYGKPPVRELGCVGLIGQHVHLEDGRFLLWLIGLERFLIKYELEAETAYRQAKVAYIPRPGSSDERARLRPLRQDLKRLLPTLVEVDDSMKPALGEQLEGMSDSQLIALACQAIEMPSTRKLQMLQARSLTDSYNMLYEDIYSRSPEQVDLAGLDPGQIN